jgi:hypothetical protein
MARRMTAQEKKNVEEAVRYLERLLENMDPADVLGRHTVQEQIRQGRHKLKTGEDLKGDPHVTKAFYGAVALAAAGAAGAGVAAAGGGAALAAAGGKVAAGLTAKKVGTAAAGTTLAGLAAKNRKEEARAAAKEKAKQPKSPQKEEEEKADRANRAGRKPRYWYEIEGAEPPSTTAANLLWDGPAALHMDSLVQTEKGRMRTYSPKQSAPVSDTGGKYKRVRDLIGDLLSMDNDSLVVLQMGMYDAGLFGDGKPIWGVVDGGTQDAYRNLLAATIQNPGSTVTEMLRRLQDQQAEEVGRDAQKKRQDRVVELTDPATVRTQANDMARQILGRRLTAEEEQVLVSMIHGREQQQATKAFDMSDELENAGLSDLDKFMAAIASKESGGNYDARNPDSGAYGKFQIMPSNWPAWSQAAGLPPHAPRTPENQERVARFIMAGYYKQFGNWRDVAIAWYAGPGRVNRSGGRDAPQGKYPSINKYADDVMARFHGSGPVAADPLNPESSLSVLEGFDPSANLREELRRMDPARAGAMDFSEQMSSFLDLLATTGD